MSASVTPAGPERFGFSPTIDPPVADDDAHPAVRGRMRRLCAAFPTDYFRSEDRHQGQAEAFAEALRTAGWCNALVSRAHGGLGLSLAEACAAVEAIGIQGAPAAGLVQEMCNHLLLVHHGDLLKDAYVRHVIGGTLRVPSMAIWSPGANADVREIAQCTQGVVVSGRKTRVSRVQNSDLLLLLVDGGTKHPGASLYLVDLRDAIGRGLWIEPFASRDTYDASDLLIDKLLIPANNLVGEAGQGAACIAQRRVPEMILSAAAATGDARWLLARVSDRGPGSQNDSGEGRSPVLVKAWSAIEAASVTYAKAAQRYDLLASCEGEARMALTLALEAVSRTAQLAYRHPEALGQDVDRKLRESRKHQVMPFATDLALAYISEHVLRIPRHQ